MLYCVSLLEKPIKKGELQGKCVFDYTGKQFLHFMLFFIWWERTLLDSELRLYYKSISSTVVFFLIFTWGWKCVSVCVCVCMYVCICIKESRKHPHLMDKHGLKFRAMQGPYWVLLWDVYTMWRSEVIFVKFYILSLL